MITTFDNDNTWFWSDGETLWGEDGTKRKVTTADIIFTTGKYVNNKLSEVSDSWYLKFIMDKNPTDHFIKKMFTLRLGELSI